MTKVQLVMPAINLWRKYTEAALNSAQAAMAYAHSKDIECRLLFIDNASTDETREEAGKRVSDRFSHKRNEVRWGFQQSVNFGVNDAWERDFEYALVLNNDILLHPASIARLVEGFSVKNDKLKPIGMVTCLDVRGETDPQGLLILSSAAKENVPVSPHPNFSAFMLKRETWETVGEFDEIFHPAYYEDNCYHYRMKLAGLEAITYPPAMFYHYGSRTQNEADETGRPIVDSSAQHTHYRAKWGGDPGAEQFTHPFNDPLKSIRSTKQNPRA